MKSSNYCILIFLLAITVLIGCNKENPKTDDPTSQINKIETSLNKGESKIEGINTGSKVETKAPDGYLNSIQEALEKSYSKIDATKSAANTYLVGVVSNGSCGSNQKLTIYMDCEDSRSPDTRIVNWVGDTYTSGGNAYFSFCLVDGSSFQRTTQFEYATLRVDATLPFGVSTFSRYFDNEDSGNGNSWAIDGVNQPKTGTLGACSFGKNDLLAFNYYTVSGTYVPFPDLGISYGVIGQFGTSGYIHTDDEDSDNSDWTTLMLFNDATQTYGSNSTVSSGNVSDLLSGESQNKNTTLYMSKIH